jgi:alpha-mannosidase
VRSWNGWRQAGKLVIGPWYVLPDEFLVAGESLLRNLRLGRQIARDFGGQPSRCRLRLRSVWPQQPDAADFSPVLASTAV